MNLNSMLNDGIEIQDIAYNMKRNIEAYFNETFININI